MGRIIDYPKASYKSAQDMANAVDSLGGSCSVDLCAEKMGLKLSGAFSNTISAAQKFRLVNHKAGQLSTSQLYRDIKLSYTEDEKYKLLRSSFLSPAVFSRLYDRFKGEILPVALLEKMFIKEYQVDDRVASRLKKYFIDGAKTTQLINAQNQLIKIDNAEEVEITSEVEESSNQALEASTSFENHTLTSFLESDEFVFHITGPGINSRVAIREEEDFIILEAMIKKVKKRFDALEI
jgi:hypothetical protein